MTRVEAFVRDNLLRVFISAVILMDGVFWNPRPWYTTALVLSLYVGICALIDYSAYLARKKNTIQ